MAETRAEHYARRALGPNPDAADQLDVWRFDRRLARNTVFISIVALVAVADLALTFALFFRGGWT